MVRANANLMAAAPDMLEALEQILREKCYEPESNIEAICSRAIAKAKGE